MACPVSFYGKRESGVLPRVAAAVKSDLVNPQHKPNHQRKADGFDHDEPNRTLSTRFWRFCFFSFENEIPNQGR
jgi:hypothetical protein